MPGTACAALCDEWAYKTAYTVCVKPARGDVHKLNPIRLAGSCTLRAVAEDDGPDDAWKKRIGSRIRELRDLKGWSLMDLERRTAELAQKHKEPGLQLTKSRLSNYEQGIRMAGPFEATVLGMVFEEAPAHILCLDDQMPALSKKEADLIRNIRALPENQREEYLERIANLALAYRKPVSDERVTQAGFTRPRRSKAKRAT